MGNNKSKRLSPKSINDLQQSVDFSAEDIQAFYKEYQESKNGRYLTEKEFEKVYSNAFRGDAKAFAKHMFRTFDTNGNGKVDFKEFLIGLSVTSGKDSRKLRWAFEMYDIDGSGTIDRGEMLSLMRAIFSMTPFIKKPEDMNTPEKITEKLFKEMDLDGDGEISWEEFSEVAKRNPVVVSILQLNPDTE